MLNRQEFRFDIWLGLEKAAKFSSSGIFGLSGYFFKWLYGVHQVMKYEDEFINPRLGQGEFASCKWTFQIEESASFRYVKCETDDIAHKLIQLAYDYAEPLATADLQANGEYIVISCVVAGIVLASATAFKNAYRSVPVVPVVEELAEIVIEEKSFEDRYSATGWEGRIPDEFNCPVNLTPMDNPVVVNSGHSLDASALKSMAVPKKCPFTRQLITVTIPNLTLKKLIRADVEEKERWAEEQVKPAEVLALPAVSELEEKEDGNLQEVNGFTLFGIPQQQIKRNFLCALTNQLMAHPVTASDGKNYEKKAILEHIGDNPNPVSPHTEEPLKRMLKDSWVAPNERLAKEIRGFLTLEARLKKYKQDRPSELTTALLENIKLAY